MLHCAITEELKSCHGLDWTFASDGSNNFPRSKAGHMKAVKMGSHTYSTSTGDLGRKASSLRALLSQANSSCSQS